MAAEIGALMSKAREAVIVREFDLMDPADIGLMSEDDKILVARLVDLARWNDGMSDSEQYWSDYYYVKADIVMGRYDRRSGRAGGDRNGST